MISGIYEIKNNITGDFYIGSSNDLKRRLNAHRSLLNRNLHHSSYLQHAWNKYGETNFQLRVVCLCNKENLLRYEQILLDNLHPSYNMAKDALAPMRGRTLSDDSKKTLSAVHKGRVVSEETKKKIGAGHKGKEIGNSNAAKTYAGFISPGGEVYENITNLSKFCRSHGLGATSMLKLAKGKRNHHKGWKALKET